MIIGEKFVWAHMPKTAGNSTATMFDLFEKHIVRKDPLNLHKKHDTFKMREKFSGLDLSVERKRILNIRRLASWTLSLAQHQLKHAKIDMHIEELAVGKIRINNGRGGYKLHSADDFLSNFMSGRVDYWFRTEHLAEDFVNVMRKFFDIDESKVELISGIKENQNNQYKKDLLLFFTKDQILSLYNSSPKWARIESEIFGDTIAELL